MWNKWTVHTSLVRIHRIQFRQHLTVSREDNGTIRPTKHTRRTDSEQTYDVCPQRLLHTCP